MKSIVKHLESAEQLKTVKVLKGQFETQRADLPSHVSKSVEKSIKQFEDGQTISLREFKEKHFAKTSPHR